MLPDISFVAAGAGRVATGHPVVVGIALEQVLTRAAVQVVVVGPAVLLVATLIALELVGPGLAEQGVGAGLAVQAVVTSPAYTVSASFEPQTQSSPPSRKTT